MDDRALFALVLFAGVAVPGVFDFALAQAGYGSVGAAVWAVGYLGTVLFIWFLWLRPLEFDPGPGSGAD